MYIIIPAQGYYGDFATVIDTAVTAEEAIRIADENDAVAYRASGYAPGDRVSRAAINIMRNDSRFLGPIPRSEPGMGLFSRK
jgi:hypothetical protein